ncbi:RIB43A-like with coiled-coils protein 1 [Engraulis encrasicolus]|uniref:RIB43A-like with coiled-coils protein 1 n=1 Tax=Engraulis encrasicolus TaxID=184585 RepID=UPI002FCE7A5D
MYKVDLPVENSAALAVESRRAAEEARRSRIFNARTRVIGLDLQGLDWQVAEKKERHGVERECQKAYDILRVTNDQMLERGQREEEEKRRQLMEDVVRFRATHQRPEDSRDADLQFDPQGTRVFIPQGKMGAASMRVFQGEDLGEKERKKAQKKETERQLRAQKEDAEKQRQAHKHQVSLQDKYLVHQDLRSAHLQTLDEEARRAERLALASFNQALAQQRAAKERSERELDEGLCMREIKHMLSSDILTGRPEASNTPLGGVLSDRWRGMTPEQRDAILREQEQQRKEKERRRQQEQQRERGWDEQRLAQARALEEQERKSREVERLQRIQMDKQNQQLAQEQREYQQYLDKQLYRNQPNARYFTQFNTSTR